MKIPRSLVCIVPLVMVASCITKDVVPRYSPAWEEFQPKKEDGWHNSRKVLLVSDCQLHNLYSQAIPERNPTAVAAINTAIRPPQLDLFSADVLEWILTKGAANCQGVLHLGDALDLACEGELRDFLEVMRTAKKPWLMAPGNHDFYYFGTYNPEDVELWDRACYGSTRRLPKDRFIRLYVSAILGQDDAGCRALARALKLFERRKEDPAVLAALLPDSFEWHAQGRGPGLLDAIAWDIDSEAPWRSFLLQAANLDDPAQQEGPRIRALLMDSCQFQREPTLIPNAWECFPIRLNCGSSGEMLPNQLRLIRKWVETAGPEVSNHWTMMCHHPFGVLAPRTKSSLGWLWSHGSVSLFVSAHTHKGHYVYHDLGQENAELELNLGSTTDWPMDWRTLEYFWNKKQKQVFVETERHTMIEEVGHKPGFFERSWEVSPGSNDDYRKYTQGQSANSLLFDFYLAHHMTPPWLGQPRIPIPQAATDSALQVKNTMLATYFRLVATFPTRPSARDPHWPQECGNDEQVMEKLIETMNRKVSVEDKVAFLKEMASFERHRASEDPLTGKPNDEARARFKISQAVWGSRYAWSTGRSLRTDDELIRVDWRKSAARERRIRTQAR